MSSSEAKMPTCSFVTSILANAGRLDKEDLNTKLSQLSRKAGEMKIEVFDALHKNYKEFFPNFDSINLVSKKVNQFRKEMEELSMNIENQLKAQMQMSSAAKNDKLLANWTETRAILDLLNQVIEIHGGLVASSKDIDLKCFLEAAKHLNGTEKIISDVLSTYGDSVKVFLDLQTRHMTLKEQLVHDMQTSWSENFRWNVVKEGAFGANDETVVELLLVSSKELRSQMQDVVRAMDSTGTLDANLKTFGEKLKKHLLKPLLAVPGVKISSGADLAWSRIRIVTPGAGAKGATQKVPDAPHVLHEIESIFNFLHQCFSEYSTPDTTEGSPGKGGTPGIPLMARLGRHLADELVDLVISESISKAVPSNRVDLKDFQIVIAATESLQQKLISVRFLDDTKLLDYVDNVDLVFANKKCQEILERARDLMKSEIHNEISVAIDDCEPKDLKLILPEEDLSKGQAKERAAELVDSKLLPPFRFPKCKISSCAYELVKLSYQLLQEAVASFKSGNQNSENKAGERQCAIQLFYGVRNMFELYCNVFPVTHKKLLRTVPVNADSDDAMVDLCNRFAAIHHNDCMYFAHHLTLLGHQFRPHLPEPLCHGAATFVDLVPVFRRLGAKSFMEMLTRQKNSLIACLSTAQGFANIGEGENYEKVDLAVHKLFLKLRHLVNAWKDVLPANVFNKSIGTLLNCIIAEMLTKIGSLEDISESDAKFIGCILQFFSKSGSDLFHDSVSGSIFKFVPKWNKMEEMKFLLTARLQEIVDRWADGKGPLAAEFTAVELKQLIRALFQNTEKRAAALTAIK